MEELVAGTKIFALVLFFAIYLGVVWYAFRKKGAERFEEYRHIPLNDDKESSRCQIK